MDKIQIPMYKIPNFSNSKHAFSGRQIACYLLHVWNLFYLKIGIYLFFGA
ncbi:MAG: hypothetical protein K9J13_08170 [Saprospiraceae bacterium]|nr:hypothetical protein [Saprospiraceae bacterium]